jgi:general secretion pathway protein A
MYASFFGLKQAPFSTAPDPRYLFMSERHREALAHLLYGVQAGGGFVLLTGEIGAGKTTVCRCFLEQVPADCQVGYIVNPKLSVGELLQTVAEEFGIPLPASAAADGAGTKTWVDALNRHLLAAHAQGRHCLLIIDEAQHLSADVLEQLRLLTNLETHERKLLQIILIGQPELRSQLAAPGMEQLAQRVIARYHLQALSPAETLAYLAHRLAVAGLAGANPFDAGALRRIHALTGGVPRRINLVCDRALLGAYAHGQARVDRRTVEQAAREVFGQRTPAAGAGRRWPWAAALAVAALLAVALWQLPGPVERRGSATPALAPATAGVAAAAPGLAPVAASAPGLAPVAAASPGPAPVAASAPGSVPAASAPAAVAVAAAAMPAGSAPPRNALPPLDAASDWAALSADESAGLRELATAWGVALPPGLPCAQAARQGLGCWRHRGATLPLLAQLDRPVVLALVDEAGRTAHARLVALRPDGAVLAAGERRWTLPAARLAALWRGELVTFWRLPDRIDPALAGAAAGLAPGASGAAVVALQQALARAEVRTAVQADAAPAGGPAEAASAGARFDGALRQRVAAFQLAAGLRPDGLAGPTTFMQLNRALAVDEPRLGRE